MALGVVGMLVEACRDATVAGRGFRLGGGVPRTNCTALWLHSGWIMAVATTTNERRMRLGPGGRSKALRGGLGRTDAFH